MTSATTTDTTPEAAAPPAGQEAAATAMDSEYSRAHCEHSGFCYAHNHEKEHTHAHDDHHGHCHHHHDDSNKTTAQIQHERSIRCLIMMILTGSYMVAEIVVGIVTGSLALLGDGFHMMSDFLSLIIGFLSIRMSAKRGTAAYTFGYQRAEIVGGFANAVFLVSAVIFIVIDAIERFIDIPTIEKSTLMFGVAIGGLVINILGLFIFHEHGPGHNHDHSHGHGHGHSHEHEHEHEHGHGHEEKHGSTKSVAIRGMFLHVLGDFLGSIAALISGLIITYAKFEGRYYFDPACSLIICALIIISAVPLLRETLQVMMQATPKDINLEGLRESVLKISEVESIHELHIWNLGSIKYVAACHAVLTGDATASLDTATYRRVQGEIENVFHNSGIHNATVQIEPEPEAMSAKRRGKRGLTEMGAQALCPLRRDCTNNKAWCCQDAFVTTEFADEEALSGSSD